MVQIPRADPGKKCPFNEKPVEDVCHECPLWVLVRGKNPQSGADVDEWNCSLAFLPMLLIEGARQARSAAVATENLRNETSASVRATTAVFSKLAEISTARLGSEPPIELIEKKS